MIYWKPEGRKQRGRPRGTEKCNIACCFYGCDVWSLIRGTNRLKVFKNGMLEKIFGPKREGVQKLKKMAVQRTALFAPLTKYYSGD
jgi:hypothetical protein